MDRRGLALGVAVAAALSGCTADEEAARTPGLEERGTVLTSVKPTRQDLSNQISLSGKVTINPVFGIVAPTAGEIRYVQRQPNKTPAAQPLWVATVWDDGTPRRINIPEGSMLAGRLMEDRAEVAAGMPIVSARHGGYGIVADIDSAQAYRVSGSAKTVKGQIKNGPGPFSCTTLGTIAALPEGTIPEPPPPATTAPTPGASGGPAPVQSAPVENPEQQGPQGSESTGMRLVCAPPASVKLINGADVTLSVVTDRAVNAMVLPVEAVAGTQGRGKVDVLTPDRTRKTVDVVLGLTDGKVVQIKSGLRGDEEIAVPGPDLPAAEGPK
ncbi:efflux RND transporter periplasmic adaptor subunit [Paractinoplanes deccanensis]|uniref:efflux RND transporter periplasmic adaptor subunit n=1 Tax=Paractinoplanes deccanensis TaxID=113561 RepID=UPI001944E298|nr:efflux RND transporter periplasmic adaptor subunit [Actinoplanes deccanensis]